jgi:hypothetical protein
VEARGYRTRAKDSGYRPRNFRRAIIIAKSTPPAKPHVAGSGAGLPSSIPLDTWGTLTVTPPADPLRL